MCSVCLAVPCTSVERSKILCLLNKLRADKETEEKKGQKNRVSDIELK